MSFGVMPFAIVLAILLVAGLALIIDAIRRGLRDRQR